MTKKLSVFFHEEQLLHTPLYEYAFGEKINHPETTHRAQSILNSLGEHPDQFDITSPESFPMSSIKEMHNSKMIKAIQAASSLSPNQTFYPSVFPYYRDKSRLDPTNIRHAGAFCFDNGTPLDATTFAAAAWSAADAVDAADHVLTEKSKVTYALCRPPGHHASRDLFGGYCYFNNAALAVKRLRKKAKRVAVVDIDFHHGNGTQVLFDRDPSVLVINLHGDPNEFYPYFTGFKTETGTGAGKGFNINIPLEKGTDGQEFVRNLVDDALKSLREFDPEALVISAGFDTYVTDPVGSFTLETLDYQAIAEKFIELKLPTVIIQEGGYEEISLGRNVTTFLLPFTEALSK